jgi:hypothetical protein
VPHLHHLLKKLATQAQARRRSSDQKGQASIMVGMMMLTFILFFAFVINTGMLVSAKINLQNAADLAAYAGAAVQARQLNQISYLNYEMRRQYKKFLFRYYVMGNMAQKPFPRTASSDGGKNPPNWSPDGSKNYGAPAVCMIFNSTDNFCQLPALPQISIPGSNPLDAINSTLIGQLNAIELIRQQNCVNIAFTNTTTLHLWLWNSDPDLTNLQTSLPSALQSSINTIRRLTLGIGLIPREVLLRARIDTLKDYVNQQPQTGVTYTQAIQMNQGEDPPSTERTTQAFLSAFYTLGEHTFDSTDIIMDEMTPTVELALNDIKIQFDTYAVSLKINGGMVVPASGNAGPCEPVVEADTVQDKFPIGVSKDPKTMTYYAIRLKAKAQILFSPFGDVTLKAYAAAQPFGSRIGPVLDESGFVREVGSLGLDPPPGTNNLHFVNKIPNLPIREAGDSAGASNGWDTVEALGAFYQGFTSPDQQGHLSSIDQTALQRAYQVAMVANPYEKNKYNILTDDGDAFVRNFDLHGVTAFWAPVFAPAKASQADSAIQGLIQGLMSDTRVNSAEFKQALTQELTNYISKLKTGQGEAIGGANESFNIAYIQDPLHLPAAQTGAPPQVISVPGGLSETNPLNLRTSWDGVLNSDMQATGRTGYSVKFVSFNSLLNHTSQTDGSTTWGNDMTPDAEAQLDLSIIQH